jgi:hypothetical protein
MHPKDLWFRFTNGTDTLLGRKDFRDLVFTVKTRGILLDIKIDRVSADKLREWLNRAFPTDRSARVHSLPGVINEPVHSIPRELSVQDTETDTDPDSGSPPE